MVESAIEGEYRLFRFINEKKFKIYLIGLVRGLNLN